ncbi:hypothetical protein T4E_7885 [Trichinella pseudospiralis]|uniref:Uncharacterized protein n=1 Tax=Trichinella pseudospiralis TaxID=6337 RepID=A0A0V0YEN2_TRIPS|nr:hypothetical protein T4E_7885 [Trichinella pseudospiralis]
MKNKEKIFFNSAYYRKLNAVTRVDTQSVLRIDETLDTVAETRWCSTLILALGYLKVEVAEDGVLDTSWTAQI